MVLSGRIKDGDRSGSGYVFSNLGTTPACSDGIDNDGDALADLDDPGCAVALDTSERSGLACIDESDNDGDGLVDYPEDPGCGAARSDLENPACQDGIDNEGDGLIDFDGGLSALGYAATEPDPECWGRPSGTKEGCGLGWELGPVLAALLSLYRRRRRSRS